MNQFLYDYAVPVGISLGLLGFLALFVWVTGMQAQLLQ